MIIAVLGVLGTLLPSWLYLQVQPYLSNILDVPVSAGLGFWLTLVGNTLIVVTALYQMLTISAGVINEKSVAN